MPDNTRVIWQALSDSQILLLESSAEELLRKVRDSDGELDLQIRDGYFNIYYKGNSLAKITPKPTKGAFSIEVSKSFGFPAIASRIKPPIPEADISWTETDSSDVVRVSAQWLYRLLQANTVESLKREIKNLGYGEEITFEQTLITDNLGREDLIVIDRQSQPKGRIGGKLDLLALRLQDNGHYSFLVLEVKLGDNPELTASVGEQLKGYVKLIQDNINDYISSYEENYSQKRRLGVLGESSWSKSITIDPVVEGLLVVGSYSRIAEKALQQLHNLHPDVTKQVIWCRNRINL